MKILVKNLKIFKSDLNLNFLFFLFSFKFINFNYVSLLRNALKILHWIVLVCLKFLAKSVNHYSKSNMEYIWWHTNCVTIYTPKFQHDTLCIKKTHSFWERRNKIILSLHCIEYKYIRILKLWMIEKLYPFIFNS